jgi:hypothetical protein
MVRPLSRWATSILLLCVLPRPGRAQGPGVAWELFSMRGRAFAPLFADPREARFRFGLMLNQNRRLLEDLVWGGDLGLLRLEVRGTHLVTLTGRGLMTARFDMLSGSFDLQNTDFIGGVAVGYRRSAWAAELFLFHQSSHLGDEVLESGARQRIDLGYERVRALVAYQLRWIRWYGGAHVIFHAYPESLLGETAVQLGAEVERNLGPVPFVAALDLQTRVDQLALLGLSVMVGAGFGGAGPAGQRQRVFLAYYEGQSSMGQFFAEHERHGMLGVAYVFH